MMAKRRRTNKSGKVRSEEAAPATAVSLDFDALIATWRSWIPQALLIIGAGLWINWPAVHGGWLWDDNHYISENSLMGDPLGFLKVWVTRGHLRDYCPLTSSVEWIQWQLWGNNTFGYHLTNVVLHLTGAFLLWRLLARLGLSHAWLGGLLFTVHPIMIESVAWVSELKNTLSLPLLLLSMLAWLAWGKGGEQRFYLGSLALFVASLLAKPTGMMLPVIFLGHAWQMRGKLGWNDIKVTLPFFAAACVLGFVALTPPPLPPGSEGIHPAWHLGSALATVGWSTLFMLGKCLLPVNLLPVYPSFAVTSPNVFDVLPWLALGGLAGLLWLSRAQWSRVVLLSLGFFMINLVPIIGFIFMHYPDMEWSIDHLLYLPIIGLIAPVVAGLDYLDSRVSSLWRVVWRPLFAASVIVMAWGGHAYAGWFASWESLWTNELRSQPGNRAALLNVASIFVDRNEFPKAIPYLQEALLLQPDDTEARFDLGLCLANTGQPEQAQEQYRQVIQQAPDFAKAYVSLGGMLLKAGDITGAEALYRQGLQNAPGDAALCINLGGLLMKQGRTAEVIDLYEKALESSPNLAQLQYDLGVALLGKGSITDAAEHLETAVKLDPTLVAAHENLGVALAQLGRLPEAIEQFQAVIQLNPKSVTARDNLVLALSQTGQIPEAIEVCQQTLQIDPTDARARDSLAKLQQFQMNQAAPSGH